MLLNNMSGDNVAVDNGDATENTEVKAEVIDGAEQSAETTQETDEARKRTGYQRKLDKKDAEIARLQRERDEALTAKTAKADDTDTEPKLEDFDEWGDFIKAQAKYAAKQALNEDAKSKSEKERETALRNERKTLEESYKAKRDDFRKATPDFDQVINEYDGPWNGIIQQALLESDIGPQISYYLAQNLDEADKLEGMSVLQVNRFIGRLEAKLESLQPASVKTTQAQPPIKPIRQGATVTSKDPGDMSLSEFEAWERGRKK